MAQSRAAATCGVRRTNRSRNTRVTEQGLTSDDEALVEQTRRSVTRRVLAVADLLRIESVDGLEHELTGGCAVRDGLVRDVCAFSRIRETEHAPLSGVTRASQVILKRAQRTCMRVQGSPVRISFEPADIS